MNNYFNNHKTEESTVMTCPICGKRITPQESVVKELKHIISSTPVSEDKYLQKIAHLHYYCCYSCDRYLKILNYMYKGFYAIGLVLIAIGYFTDGLLSICGAFSIVVGLLVFFLVPAICKKYPNVTLESAKEHNCLIEKHLD